MRIAWNVDVVIAALEKLALHFMQRQIWFCANVTIWGKWNSKYYSEVCKKACLPNFTKTKLICFYFSDCSEVLVIVLLVLKWFLLLKWSWELEIMFITWSASPVNSAIIGKNNNWKHRFRFKINLMNLFFRHRFCVGDRFYLCENKILCQYDYDERNQAARRTITIWNPQ